MDILPKFLFPCGGAPGIPCLFFNFLTDSDEGVTESVEVDVLDERPLLDGAVRLLVITNCQFHLGTSQSSIRGGGNTDRPDL